MCAPLQAQYFTNRLDASSKLAADALHCAASDPMQPGSLEHSDSARQRGSDSGLDVGGSPGPPQDLARAFGPCQPGSHPFLDHGALKLGEHATPII